ncbi:MULTISPECIES: acyltransferase family protein [Streptomyces]|uniref:acyltransferase family protein n=1 Tax=Streptomyces TaxID=1883 RepID=UPI0005749218|nr:MULTISPECIES: acyltransferase [Streptomyces]ARP72024.1 acyltransferase [Streptomyces pluripotens]MCH0560698.1 acyltransferase [Streptomyces sp. MUM 16J]
MADVRVRTENERPTPVAWKDLSPAPPVRLTPVRRLHRAALRIDAATPLSRDRAVDVLRAYSILGVVLGHWLVSAVVLRAGGHLGGDSPLNHMPGLTPVTWLLQPLALFFFVGGRVGFQSYASAGATGTRYRTWLAQRLRQLVRPTLALLGVWGLVLIGLAFEGVAFETIRTLLRLAVSPLWFLCVYAVITAATPLIRRCGAGRLVLVAFALVVATDLVRGLVGDLGWVDSLRWLNVFTGWLVPYALGVFWAAGGLARRRYAVGMLVCGAASLTGLVLWCGYPASMVGVPGAALSNLNPPSLAAVCFGLAQCGLGLLLCGPLRRLTGQPAEPVPSLPARASDAAGARATAGQFCWAAVALLNLSAMTIFLWHQTSMLATTVFSLGFGQRWPGLHTAPEDPFWVAFRLGWILVFACVLAVFWLAFKDVEKSARRHCR